MGYKVTDTREVAHLTQAGTEQKVYRVWLQTDNGATGSLDIPVSQWLPEKVQELLAEKAASLDLAFTIGNGA